MPKIIFIETSTSLCSTALSDGERIICTRLSSEARAHASMTAVFVKEMLDECGWKVQDCDAVCVSKGPGSYTGLRVGASTAKGLCFGGGLPLLSVGTLETLAWQAVGMLESGSIPSSSDRITIVPMIDARRMEVYTAPFLAEKKAGSWSVTPQAEVKAQVVDSTTFADRIAAGPVLFIGDGAEKCRATVLEGIDGAAVPVFAQQCPEASSMLRPALDLLAAGKIEDVAYFEPFYLKEFVATVGKRLF